MKDMVTGKESDCIPVVDDNKKFTQSFNGAFDYQTLKGL